ncbi:hypothetical protein BGZ99_003748 [Dissophora globulifera]|uniref:Rho-GAP domain-containing protein n=1 Tax=Dissophora globulifera TaxID=979702 RepID=A0A9P6RJE7_9FUNG|nr:hypothetical protein BGZ99_003748 [Dissophora globulifera]
MNNYTHHHNHSHQHLQQQQQQQHHYQPGMAPSSHPIPSLSVSSPSPAATSPPTSSRSKPKPINIFGSSKTIDLGLDSPRRGSIAAHLMSFAARSTTSLHLLSTSAPAKTNSSSSSIASSSSVSLSQDENRSQVAPLRSSAFSNPFKKLQNTLHHVGSSNSNSKSNGNNNSNSNNSNSNNSNSNMSPELGTEKTVAYASSVNSMVSWRSKGAEMLSKKAWGRARKNSEPTFGAKGVASSPIFGASLEDAVRTSHIPGTPMVPAVLLRCAEYLEAKGVDEVGLFRVPGSHASVQKLKKIFDTGKDYNLLAVGGIDPNDIATLLKLYLRELPTPLLSAVFLEQFQSVISTDRQVCYNLRTILVRLPRPNYLALSFLCHHLSRIAAHADKTKMNVSNLGVVFAPTLSIGSVLFKALLGGYYDTPDTPENRELGLQIVWGGLDQNQEYGIQERPEQSATQAYQQTNSGVQQTTVNNNINNSNNSNANLYPSTLPSPLAPAQEIVSAPTGLGLMHGMPSNHTREQDEAKLMAAMLLQEELAAKRQEDDETASNVSESSGSNPCTDTTALSAVSSPGMTAKEQAFEASFTSPSMTFSPTLTSSPPPSAIPQHAQHSLLSSPSPALPTALTLGTATTTKAAAATYPAPSTVNVTINAGSTISKGAEEQEDDNNEVEEDEDEVAEDDEETEEAEEAEEKIHAPEFPHKSASGAPQLPPLEGLMIAL